MKVYAGTMDNEKLNVFAEMKFDDGIHIIPRVNEIVKFNLKIYIVENVLHDYDDNVTYLQCTERVVKV